MTAALRAGALLLLGLAGCSVGQGEGAARGPLFILGCRPKVDTGTPDNPVTFDLNPQFFAGEPIEGLGLVGMKVNRLIIRLQTTGRSKEVNDVLMFDLPNVREVARCVRGWVDNSKGQNRPDWDTDNCFQSPNGPMLRVAPDALIRAFLSPNATCTKAFTAAGNSVVRRPNDGAWDSWVLFAEFGNAARPGPPEMRGPVPLDFMVNFGDHLRVPDFKLTLTDFTGLQGDRYGFPLPPPPQIGGELTGFFDFTVKRGQGAQTFP